MIAALLALAVQGPAAADPTFQQEQAAATVYAACLFRENEQRRAAHRTSLENFGSSCGAERQDIACLDLKAGRSAEVSAAHLIGIDDTMRENLARMNKLYPSQK